jgi:hypothetical protein
MHVHVFFQLSAWTIVLLTAERFIAVGFPFQSRAIFTLHRTVITWLIITVILFGVNCHFFGTVHIIDYDGIPYCNVFDQFLVFFREQWYLIDAFVGDLVPFALIFTGNVAIVIIILLRRQKAKKMTTTLKRNGLLVKREKSVCLTFKPHRLQVA